MVPPSPWNTWMISKDSRLTSFGRQRLEQRLEAAEQRGEVQRGLGLRERDDRRRGQGAAAPSPSPSVSAM